MTGVPFSKLRQEYTITTMGVSKLYETKEAIGTRRQEVMTGCCTAASAATPHIGQYKQQRQYSTRYENGQERRWSPEPCHTMRGIVSLRCGARIASEQGSYILGILRRMVESEGGSQVCVMVGTSVRSSGNERPTSTTSIHDVDYA